MAWQRVRARLQGAELMRMPALAPLPVPLWVERGPVLAEWWLRVARVLVPQLVEEVSVPAERWLRMAPVRVRAPALAARDWLVRRGVLESPPN
jgi:hypothetical protein